MPEDTDKKIIVDTEKEERTLNPKDFELDDLDVLEAQIIGIHQGDLPLAEKLTEMGKLWIEMEKSLDPTGETKIGQIPYGTDVIERRSIFRVTTVDFRDSERD